MYRKAYYFDEDTVFYFDEFDRKYVAEGGSLAWRLNNPGLLTSHSADKFIHRSIGSCHQLAIFPDYQTGRAILIEWLRSSKYFMSTLQKIAEYYQRDNFSEYLNRLCSLTGLSTEAKLNKISEKEFDRLVDAVQRLSGFLQQEREFKMLPKISARGQFLDKTFYLVGDQILSKEEAMRWVETHRLDAVIVHKNNGDAYLRSRPGHHFNRIRLTQEEYGKDRDYKEAFREVGTEIEGQCIWAFVNGVDNTKADALTSARAISKHAKGEKVWSLVNDKSWCKNYDQAAAQKLGYSTETIRFGVQFLRFLLEQSEKRTGKPPVVVFAHSQGAMIIELALNGLTLVERGRVHVYTFGGAAFIAPSKAHEKSHNYFSIADIVPRIMNRELSLLFLALNEGKKAKLSEDEILRQIAEEDTDRMLDTSDAKTRERFTKQRQEYYKKLLQECGNVSVLSENISAKWEHSFLNPSYQNQVKEIVSSYRS